ncbi:bifunctional Ribonuclease HII-HIII domain/Ribonuclease H-like superfamily/Ribonuclease HII-HIII/Ribonuclease H superfamily [Babesia duncani]|uniref:Ribonuclease n=1 Tax=Babesia duncani TaxID=323732 RepID=A0AAD9UPQ3_9APIC|nr:bifunctional Ribonuclease HII-HIII domain/Ribonuclease H-like superfamily/Ribonuclease HII-HIII/Ribonuclease H superfamily [Babesia duncani]
MEKKRLRCFRLYRNGDIDKNTPVILGIDEAGRGPVLGPMVYGGFYCANVPESNEILKKQIRVNDSKKIASNTRDEMLIKINSTKYKFGICANILTPEYISYQMLKRIKYNLNTISHDTAISIIQHVLSCGYKVEHVYIDTVGIPSAYEKILKTRFPQLNFTVRDCICINKSI